MDTITRKIKRNGRNKITIELPDDFEGEDLEVIIKPDLEKIIPEAENEKDDEKLRSELREFYSNFKVDLSNFKFNRDELHENEEPDYSNIPVKEPNVNYKL